MILKVILNLKLNYLKQSSLKHTFYAEQVVISDFSSIYISNDSYYILLRENIAIYLLDEKLHEGLQIKPKKRHYFEKLLLLIILHNNHLFTWHHEK